LKGQFESVGDFEPWIPRGDQIAVLLNDAHPPHITTTSEFFTAIDKGKSLLPLFLTFPSKEFHLMNQNNTTSLIGVKKDKQRGEARKH